MKRAKKIVRLAVIVPLVVFVSLGLLYPILRAFPLSLASWDQDDNTFSLPVTLVAYKDFFSGHRGGIVSRSLKNALVSTAVVCLLGWPLAASVRIAFGRRGFLTLVEILLILPFLFSAALRLHSLKLLLRTDGPVAKTMYWFSWTGADTDWLLYSSASVVIGLCFSYSALLLLPTFQMLKAVGDDVIWAARDLGMGGWRLLLLLMRLSRPGVLAGFVLMMLACWFSSLEYEILGRQQSVLNMLEDLVAVEKYPEAFAFALVPFFLSGISLVIIINWCTPERLLGLGDPADAS